MIALITTIFIVKFIKALLLLALFIMLWIAYQSFYAKDYASEFNDTNRFWVVIGLSIILFINLLIWL